MPSRSGVAFFFLHLADYFITILKKLMTKEQIIHFLQMQLDQKIEFLNENIQLLTEARNNEDKCTAGDKYETGRAMTQMELEKSQAQLAQTENLKAGLLRIETGRKLDTVEFGSLVQTDQGLYFFAIAIGKIEYNSDSVFCLSIVSPLGKMLQGKKAGDKVLFQGNSILIQNIL